MTDRLDRVLATGTVNIPDAEARPSVPGVRVGVRAVEIAGEEGSHEATGVILHLVCPQGNLAPMYLTSEEYAKIEAAVRHARLQFPGCLGGL